MITMMENDDLNCSLYLNSPLSSDVLREHIAAAFGGKIAGRTVLDEYLQIYLTKNEDFEPSRVGEHGGFVFYPYRAEVSPSYGMKDNVSLSEKEIYLDLLVHTIVKLRELGAQVVASCDYEGLIAEKTGWNWSEKTPHHPVLS